MHSLIPRSENPRWAASRGLFRPPATVLEFLIAVKGYWWLAFGRVQVNKPTITAFVAAIISAVVVAGCGTDAWTFGDPDDPAKDGQQSSDSSSAAANRVKFRSIHVDHFYTCGIKLDNTLLCWGVMNDILLETPDGELQMISTGGHHACGLRTDSQLVCWNESGAPASDGTREVASDEFQSISVGDGYACGLRKSGDVPCWFLDDEYAVVLQDVIVPPEGDFQSVSAGVWHTCGVHRDGRVECWGLYSSDATVAPEGEFQWVASGIRHSCGVTADGSVICWGLGYGGEAPKSPSPVRVTPTPPPSLNPPEGPFTKVSVAGSSSYDDPGNACAIRVDGSLACWGPGYSPIEVPSGAFKSVSVGPWQACGLRPDGQPECWPLTEHDLSFRGRVLPGTQIHSMALGGVDASICVVTAAGALACSVETPPKATKSKFRSVAGSETHFCATKTDQGVLCWPAYDAAPLTTPSGRFQTISIGPGYACGIRPDGRSECWGEEASDSLQTMGSMRPPSGKFQSVTTGPEGACGLRRDGTAVCWGSRFGAELVQDGPFKELQIAGSMVCGLRADQRVTCWDSINAIETVRQEGWFESLSTGYSPTGCGILTDGSVVCWPDLADRGPLDPSTKFQSVVVGAMGSPDRGYACGILRNGGLQCLSGHGFPLTIPAE